MILPIDDSWREALAPEWEKEYWKNLSDFIEDAYLHTRCFPEAKNIFRAFDLTPFDQVKVVILGQDPYHTPGAAMGLSFSVPREHALQPSLRNIFRELHDDLGITRTDPDLTDLAKQGVLLLNSVLTVESGSPASHRGHGWEQLTDAAIRTLAGKKSEIIFILWGKFAISKASLIDATRHHIITSPHPSPFSAHRGFFGSRPFSRTNSFLESSGKTPIHW